MLYSAKIGKKEKRNHCGRIFLQESGKDLLPLPHQKKDGMKKILYVLGLLALLCGCENRPSLVEQRKAEIRRNDSLELAQARLDLAHADSVATFKAFELEDLKKQFVFEKQEKYQTTGYYVLPAYKGSKERFSFFPEVEEGGKLLLVNIDKQRRYAFIEVNVNGEHYEHLLPKGLPERQRKDVEKCYALAKAMSDFTQAQKQKEKLRLKVQFYEKKRDALE